MNNKIVITSIETLIRNNIWMDIIDILFNELGIEKSDKVESHYFNKFNCRHNIEFLVKELNLPYFIIKNKVRDIYKNISPNFEPNEYTISIIDKLRNEYDATIFVFNNFLSDDLQYFKLYEDIDSMTIELKEMDGIIKTKFSLILILIFNLLDMEEYRNSEITIIENDSDTIRSLEKVGDYEVKYILK